VIEFRHVYKSYTTPENGSVAVLRDLDLRIETGEVHCLLGRSGCGKTTALRLVNRLTVPDAGVVLVDGSDVSGLEPHALRRRIGYVIQEGGLFPHMSVADNVTIMARLGRQEPSRIAARADELLSFVGLDPRDVAKRRPSQLSGGQRQRVGLARALMLDPDHVLLDEPFAALDPITRSQLHEEFERLLREVRKTVLLVTHDLAEAFRLGDRVSLIHEGAVRQTGTPSELRDKPADPIVQEFVGSHAAAGGSDA
jgi:osmoprotectant transport system ATP-binding protein